jgi:hypothetical protein
MNGMTLESKPVFVKNQLVKVVLDLSQNTFSVLSYDTNEVLSKGNSKTSAALKMAAKKSLLDLGAEFEPEVRDRLKEPLTLN